MVFRNNSISTGSGAQGHLDLARLFGNERPVEVDLGCGKGRFLVNEALSRKETNFLGIDRLSRKLKIMEICMDERDLSNVRILRLDAYHFAHHLLPRESIAVFHIYFPDPWPKKKHKKHRFITPELAHAICNALTPGGEVRIMTDDWNYFNTIVAAFMAEPGFERIDFYARPVRVMTEFEDKFREDGKSISKTAYKKRPLR